MILDRNYFDLYEYEVEGIGVRKDFLREDTITIEKWVFIEQNILMTFNVDSVIFNSEHFTISTFQSRSELLAKFRTTHKKYAIAQGDSLQLISLDLEFLRSGYSLYRRRPNFAKYEEAVKYFDLSYNIDSMDIYEKSLEPYSVLKKDTFHCLETYNIDGDVYMEGFGIIKAAFSYTLKKIDGVKFETIVSETCNRFGLTKEKTRDN